MFRVRYISRLGKECVDKLFCFEGREVIRTLPQAHELDPVSYTHLTLPTTPYV